MIQKRTNYLLLFLFLALNGCNIISAGHGSLTSYDFETNKAKLEAAVMKVIAENKNIYREPEPNQEAKDIYKEIAKERNKDDESINTDTTYVDYYNDGKDYLTIKIKDKNYRFTFRYYGDEETWKTSPTSSFFIVYAYNELGQGGGYNDNLDPKLLKQLTAVFESELANKVEKELGLKYTAKE